MRSFEGRLDKKWFDHVKFGRKTVEGRLNRDKYAEIKAGDKIVFTCADEKVTVLVIGTATYASFKDMLETEGILYVLPGVENIDEGCDIYEKIYKDLYETEVVALRIWCLST